MFENTSSVLAKIATTQPTWMKSGIGADVQEKIRTANSILYELGMSSEQVHWIIALIDHESAGTWDENVVGDYGCAVGIAQWNNCVGNYGPKDFNGQVKQVGEEMMTRFYFFPLEIAVGKHNAPNREDNSAYIARIRASTKIFYPE